MTARAEFLFPEPTHGIAPLHLSWHCFPDQMSPTTLIGKPFRAGDRSFRIAAVEEYPDEVVITLGQEIT